jgi:hypothetical protein
LAKEKEQLAKEKDGETTTVPKAEHAESLATQRRRLEDQVNQQHMQQVRSFLNVNCVSYICGFDFHFTTTVILVALLFHQTFSG